MARELRARRKAALGSPPAATPVRAATRRDLRGRVVDRGPGAGGDHVPPPRLQRVANHVHLDGGDARDDVRPVRVQVALQGRARLDRDAAQQGVQLRRSARRLNAVRGGIAFDLQQQRRTARVVPRACSPDMHGQGLADACSPRAFPGSQAAPSAVNSEHVSRPNGTTCGNDERMRRDVIAVAVAERLHANAQCARVVVGRHVHVGGPTPTTATNGSDTRQRNSASNASGACNRVGGWSTLTTTRNRLAENVHARADR